MKGKRFAVLLALAAVLLVSTPTTTRGLQHEYVAATFEQLTIGATAVGLDAATIRVNGREVTLCTGYLETADVRYRVDGTDPTSTTGALIRVGDLVDIKGSDNVRRFKTIRTGSTSGVLPLTCYFPR